MHALFLFGLLWVWACHGDRGAPTADDTDGGRQDTGDGEDAGATFDTDGEVTDGGSASGSDGGESRDFVYVHTEDPPVFSDIDVFLAVQVLWHTNAETLQPTGELDLSPIALANSPAVTIPTAHAGQDDACWILTEAVEGLGNGTVGPTIDLVVGDTPLPLEYDDGIYYTDVDRPQKQAIAAAGGVVVLGGQNTGTQVPEGLSMVDLADAWSGMVDGADLELVWHPAEVEVADARIHFLALLSDGTQLDCVLQDDGMATIALEGVAPLSGVAAIGRAVATEVDSIAYGRVLVVVAQDLFLMSRPAAPAMSRALFNPGFWRL